MILESNINIKSDPSIIKYRILYSESIDFFYKNFNVYNLNFVDFEKLVSGFFYHAISSLLVMPDDLVDRSRFRNDLIFIPSDLYLKPNDNLFRKVLVSNGLISNNSYPANNYKEYIKNVFKKTLVSYSKFKSLVVHETCMLSFVNVLKNGFGYLPNLTKLYYSPKIVFKKRDQFYSDNKYIQVLIELYPVCFFEDSKNFKKSTKKLPLDSYYFQGIGYYLDPLFFFTIINNKSNITGLAHGGSYDIFIDDIPTEIEKKINNKYFSWVSQSCRIAPIRFINKSYQNEKKMIQSNKILWVGSANVTSKNIYSFRLSESEYNDNILKVYSFLIQNKLDFRYKAHPIGIPSCLKEIDLKFSSDPIKHFNKYKLVIFDMPDATLLWYCISHNINFIVLFSSKFLPYFTNDFKNYQSIKSNFFLNSDALNNLDLSIVDNSSIFKLLYGFVNISDINIHSYFKNLVRI